MVLSKLRVKLSFAVIVAIVSFVNNKPFDAVILPAVIMSPPNLWSPVPLALIWPEEVMLFTLWKLPSAKLNSSLSEIILKTLPDAEETIGYGTY